MADVIKAASGFPETFRVARRMEQADSRWCLNVGEWRGWHSSGHASMVGPCCPRTISLNLHPNRNRRRSDLSFKVVSPSFACMLRSEEQHTSEQLVFESTVQLGCHDIPNELLTIL